MTVVAEPVPLLTKLTPTPRLHPNVRAKELREAAMHTEATSYSTEVTVRSLVHESLLRNGAAEATRVFGEYRNALLTADRIESNDDDWWYYAADTGTATRGDAVYELCKVADACLRILLGGHGAARHIHTTERAGA